MKRYCSSLTRYTRRPTVAVAVGGTVIGSGYPIRLQSMTTTDTNNTDASVAQSKAIADAGGELVRLTAQGRREAENLAAIHSALRSSGYTVPLVADIHFNPAAAIIAATHVEKVRINPGNFVDKRADFTHVEYTDAEYAEELSRLRAKFIEFLDVCRSHGTAIRIGVNHGSLSDRIMSRYGDTPAGMVESAMEFLRICRDENFDSVVLSMKSSNVRVMVSAYRMMAMAMEEADMHYPLHLGVTEAGEGEDGRIKSAVGIGTLLADGLGDTIRVSLTEAPEAEIPVAAELVAHFDGRDTHAPIPEIAWDTYDPYEYRRRASMAVGNVGGENPPVVVGSAAGADLSAEDAALWLPLRLSTLTAEAIESLKSNPYTIILVDTDNINSVGECRAFFARLSAEGIAAPVVLHRRYAETSLQSLQLKAAADLGALLIDGFGDGVYIENSGSSISAEELLSLSLGILQAARVRISKTEFISCPGCGRTLYDLQQTVSRIRSRCGHLVGLKIAVMGCIVNGPGEMADADYGYVGAGVGQITLYRGKEVIRRNIPQNEALDGLVALIESDGRWQNPQI